MKSFGSLQIVALPGMAFNAFFTRLTHQAARVIRHAVTFETRAAKRQASSRATAPPKGPKARCVGGHAINPKPFQRPTKLRFLSRPKEQADCMGLRIIW